MAQEGSDANEATLQGESESGHTRRWRRRIRMAAGVLLVVVLVAQFFTTRADIGNFSGIENVQVYMKGVFNAVIAIGIVVGVFIVTRESTRSE